MKYSLKATSIIEAIVVLLIIVTGVVGMYSIYIQSIRLSEGTAEKIQAIQIAREGIEAMIQVRDTNWNIFSDYENCWNSFHYDSGCISNNSATTDIPAGSYIIYKGNDGFWNLIPRTSGSYTGSYINSFDTGFAVGKESSGFYTQSGGLATGLMNPRYTREIRISYPGGDSNSGEMNIISLVQWSNRNSLEVKTVELDTVLTNWRD
ncbi:hypothetical protein MK079_01655 [Candidatus Gracilibacteria bacterium]|nr:hypothetical protein [Candidatus Gracilibacteria bacterium]